jgi:hypothetical protein
MAKRGRLLSVVGDNAVNLRLIILIAKKSKLRCPGSYIKCEVGAR